MTKRRNKNLLVRVTEEERAALNKVAADLDVPAAQLVRHAIKTVVNEEQVKRS